MAQWADSSRSNSQWDIDQNLFPALAGDKINCLWQRVILQKLSFAFSRFFFIDGPGLARSALQLPSLGPAAPFLFPLGNQSGIEFRGSVRRSRGEFQRRRRDDDGEQFADLIWPAAFNVEIRDRVSLGRNINELTRGCYVSTGRSCLRREDEIGDAHRPISINFAVNYIKVALFATRNLDADSH